MDWNVGRCCMCLQNTPCRIRGSPKPLAAGVAAKSLAARANQRAKVFRYIFPDFRFNVFNTQHWYYTRTIKPISSSWKSPSSTIWMSPVSETPILIIIWWVHSGVWLGIHQKCVQLVVLHNQGWLTTAVSLMAKIYKYGYLCWIACGRYYSKTSMACLLSFCSCDKELLFDKEFQLGP